MNRFVQIQNRIVDIDQRHKLRGDDNARPVASIPTLNAQQRGASRAVIADLRHQMRSAGHRPEPQDAGLGITEPTVLAPIPHRPR